MRKQTALWLYMILLLFLCQGVLQASVDFNGGYSTVGGTQFRLTAQVIVYGDAGPYDVRVSYDLNSESGDLEDPVIDALSGEQKEFRGMVDIDPSKPTVSTIVLTAYVTDRFGCVTTKLINVTADASSNCPLKGIGSAVTEVWPESDDSYDGSITLDLGALAKNPGTSFNVDELTILWTLPDGSQVTTKDLSNIGPGTYKLTIRADCFSINKNIVIGSCTDYFAQTEVPDPSVISVCRDASFDDIDVVRQGSFDFSVAMAAGFTVDGQISGFNTSGVKVVTVTQTSNACKADKEYELGESAVEVSRPAGTCNWEWKCPEVRGDLPGRMRIGKALKHPTDCAKVVRDCSQAVFSDGRVSNDNSDARRPSENAEIDDEEIASYGSCTHYRLFNVHFPEETCGTWGPDKKEEHVVFGSVNCENNSFTVEEIWEYGGDFRLAARAGFNTLFSEVCTTYIRTVTPGHPTIRENCSDPEPADQVCELPFPVTINCANGKHDNFLVKDKNGWRRPSTEADRDLIDQSANPSKCSIEDVILEHFSSNIFRLPSDHPNYSDVSQIVFRLFDNHEQYLLIDAYVKDELGSDGIARLTEVSTDVFVFSTAFACTRRAALREALRQAELAGARILNDIVVYPNPTIEAFNLVLNDVSESSISITLYDMSGRKVSNQGYTDNMIKFSVDVTDLPAGMYFGTVRINKTGEIKRFKISKATE